MMLEDTTRITLTFEAQDAGTLATLIAAGASALEGEARITSAEGKIQQTHRLWRQADRLFVIALELRGNSL